MKALKYSNIDDALPCLTCVLKDAIQSDTLKIEKVNRLCTKYHGAVAEHPQLSDAEFVVYSPYVKQTYHPFEHFVFLDRCGKCICHVSGLEMELTGLCHPCTNLVYSPDYLREHPEEQIKKAV